MSEESSIKIWKQYIDDLADSYFRLPDTNWIVREKRTIIGEWIKDFNNDNAQSVQYLLHKKVIWQDDDLVFFV